MSEENAVQQKKNALNFVKMQLKELPSIDDDRAVNRAEAASEMFGLIAGSFASLFMLQSTVDLSSIIGAFERYIRSNPEMLIKLQKHVFEELIDRLEADLLAAETAEQKYTVIHKHIDDVKDFNSYSKIVAIWLILRIAEASLGYLVTEVINEARQTLNGPEVHQQMEQSQYVVVSANNVNLRSFPSLDQTNVIRRLPKGFVLRQTEVRGEWTNVSVPLSDLGGSELTVGWINNEYIRPLAP